MKPTFALDLSRDAIALLHRNPKGWLSIGEVAFDAPDREEALDYLRKTALGLSPMGLACKVILPNSQVLYTEVSAPGPSRNDKRRQIAEALEGQTPYAVEDLVFDWSGKGATVKVAVVARETLDEAEGFAMAHRLNPVSFVAIPPEGSFVGEAWFGPTTASETLLAPGEVVDRDREPVTILQRDLPVAAAAAPVEPAPVAADPAPAAPEEDAGSAAAQPSQAPLAADLPEAEPLPEDLAAPRQEEPSQEAVKADEAEVALPAASDDAAEAALAAALSDPVAPPEDTPATKPSAAEPAEVEEAPFAHVTDGNAFPDSEDTVSPGDSSRQVPPFDDIPPAPSIAAIAAFASRRSAATGAAPGATRGAVPSAAGDRPVGPATQTDRPGFPLAQPIPRPAAAKGFTGPVTAPTIPGTRAKPKGRLAIGDSAAALPDGPTTVKSPARPGGTFGTAAPPRNRTGIVFLVLVALLLTFLAIIAAWSSMWLSGNGPTQVDVGQAVEEPLPSVDDELLADMQDPEGMTAPLAEAEGARPVDVGALATEDVPVDLALDAAQPTAGDAPVAADAPADTGPVADVAAPEIDTPAATAEDPALAEDAAVETATAAPTEAPASDPLPVTAVEATAAAAPEPAPEPAPGTSVATDLTAAEAPPEDQDEIFLAAMDAPPPALDALALPSPAKVVDNAPDAAMPPPAFGTVYRFDANGLVMPTPEGLFSPEGVFLIAGKPPRIPPSRSEVAAAAALAALPAPDVTAETAPAAAPTASDASLVTGTGAPVVESAPAADPAMAGFRPRPRPEGLAPATDDDAALATESPTAVVGLRPLARPANVIAAAAARPAESADLGAQAASLAAQAEADLAAAAALEATNPSIVAISRRPETRPRDLSRAVEAAVAAAVRAPEATPEPEPQPEAEVVVAAAAAPAPDLKPEELDEVNEPETSKAAPKIPTKASVAKQATYVNAINLSKVNLIGTYGTDSKRYALVRQANGRYKKVKVGDKIDGGTVKAITATEVRYQKGGKLVTLAMPKA
jgi:hypothetical protein